MRSVAVRSLSCAFIAAVRSARNLSLRSAMMLTLRRAASPGPALGPLAGGHEATNGVAVDMSPPDRQDSDHEQRRRRISHVRSAAAGLSAPRLSANRLP